MPNPLPGCLETLLKKHLLQKAKTDTLAKVRKMVEKDPDNVVAYNAVSFDARLEAPAVASRALFGA